MPNRLLVAGVDSSTQSCKVVVCDAETGAVVRTGRASHPDGTEVDPRHWWAAWQEAVGDGLLDGVSAMAVGGQQHGMVLLDEYGEVVRDALLWNDIRSAQAAADLVAELGAQAWADATGLVPLASITVTKLAGSPPMSRRAGQGAACVLPHDWLTGRFRDRRHHSERWTTDGGDASGTGYWSAGDGDYRPDLLHLAIGRRPRRAARGGAGRGRGAHGIRPGRGCGTGDNMGAALGLGLDPGDVVVSLGTSGTAFARNSRRRPTPPGSCRRSRMPTGGFLPLVCTLNAARVLTAGAAMLGIDYAGLDRWRWRANRAPVA